MPTRQDADKVLNLIVSNAPGLAQRAVRVLRYREDGKAIKLASELSREALVLDTFTQKERSLLASMAAIVDEENRSLLMRIRLSPPEFAYVEAQSEAEGFKNMSAWARWKMLGVKD